MAPLLGFFVERPFIFVERLLIFVERLLIFVERLVIFVERPLAVANGLSVKKDGVFLCVQ